MGGQRGWSKPTPYARFNRNNRYGSRMVCCIPLNERSGTTYWDHAGNIAGMVHRPPDFAATATGTGTTIKTTENLAKYFINAWVRPLVSAGGNSGAKQITSIAAGTPNTITLTGGATWAANTVSGDTFTHQPIAPRWTVAKREDGWFGVDGPDYVLDMNAAGGTTATYPYPIVFGGNGFGGNGEALNDPFYSNLPYHQDGYTLICWFRSTDSVINLPQYLPDTDGSDMWGPHPNSVQGGANTAQLTIKTVSGTTVPASYFHYEPLKWVWCALSMGKWGGRIYSNQYPVGASPKSVDYPVLQQEYPTGDIFQTWVGLTGNTYGASTPHFAPTTTGNGRLWFGGAWLGNETAPNFNFNTHAHWGGYEIIRGQTPYEEIADLFFDPFQMFEEPLRPYWAFSAGVLNSKTVTATQAEAAAISRAVASTMKAADATTSAIAKQLAITKSTTEVVSGKINFGKFKTLSGAQTQSAALSTNFPTLVRTLSATVGSNASRAVQVFKIALGRQPQSVTFGKLFSAFIETSVTVIPTLMKQVFTNLSTFVSNSPILSMIVTPFNPVIIHLIKFIRSAGSKRRRG